MDDNEIDDLIRRNRLLAATARNVALDTRWLITSTGQQGMTLIRAAQRRVFESKAMVARYYRLKRLRDKA